MKCKEVRKHFPDFLIGNLEESAKSEIQTHLASCASCREEWENLGRMWAKLEMLPKEKPSEALHTRFHTMLEAYKQGLQQAKSTPQWRNILDRWLERWWPRKPAFQFALALMLLVGGLVVGSRFAATGRSNGELAQLRTEIHSMRRLVTLSLLHQQSPIERLRGVSWSYRVEQPDTEVLSALLNTLNYDSNVNVRLAAVDALYLFHDRPMVKEGLIKSFSQQTSPMVQIALIDLMVEIRERKSIEALRLLIQDNKLHPTVKERAEWGIQQLS